MKNRYNAVLGPGYGEWYGKHLILTTYSDKGYNYLRFLFISA
jgi:hypothetical protein